MTGSQKADQVQLRRRNAHLFAATSGLPTCECGRLALWELDLVPLCGGCLDRCLRGLEGEVEPGLSLERHTLLLGLFMVLLVVGRAL